MRGRFGGRADWSRQDGATDDDDDDDDDEGPAFAHVARFASGIDWSDAKLSF